MYPSLCFETLPDLISEIGRDLHSEFRGPMRMYEKQRFNYTAEAVPRNSFQITILTW